MQITAGGFHFLAVLDNGDCYAWGNNQYGQLGDGTTQDRHSPVLILREVKKVAAGWYHSLAITDTGDIVAWGRNSCGQLGDGTKTTRLRPVKVAGLDGLGEAIAAGMDHSLGISRRPGFIKSDLLGWGANVAAPSTSTCTFTGISEQGLHPSFLLDGKGVVDISAGRNHTLARTRDGHLYAWGRNSFGQIGDRTTVHRPEPVKIMEEVKMIAAGVDYSLVVTESEQLLSFGCNTNGRLGDGDTAHRQVPVVILEGVKQIAAGHSHAFALLEGHELVGWGCNMHGCVIQDVMPEILEPTKVLSGVSLIAAGGCHSLARLLNGEYTVWGRGWHGSISCLQDFGASAQLNWRLDDDALKRLASGYEAREEDQAARCASPATAALPDVSKTSEHEEAASTDARRRRKSFQEASFDAEPGLQVADDVLEKAVTAWARFHAIAEDTVDVADIMHSNEGLEWWATQSDPSHVSMRYDDEETLSQADSESALGKDQSQAGSRKKGREQRRGSIVTKEHAEAAALSWREQGLQVLMAKFGQDWEVHGRVHAKAKVFSRGYSLVWEAYRRHKEEAQVQAELEGLAEDPADVKDEDRPEGPDYDEMELHRFHANLILDIERFKSDHDVPGGAQQFGWPDEAFSVFSGVLPVEKALREASKVVTGNEDLFGMLPHVLDPQRGPGESLVWPSQRPALPAEELACLPEEEENSAKGDDSDED